MDLYVFWKQKNEGLNNEGYKDWVGSIQENEKNLNRQNNMN
jgi:hypothetical protein